MKKLSIIFCICTLLLSNLLAGCGSKEPAPAADHKLRVVVTLAASATCRSALKRSTASFR